MNPEAGSLLIVDDDEINRGRLSRHLERHGFAVTPAEDGTRALELIRKNCFDLVLLDILMPGLSGFEVLKILRQAHSVTNLPIIMATAKDQSGDVVEALKLGANDYVTKPFDFPVVLARVQTQLALKRSVDRIIRLEQSLAQRNGELEEANQRMKRDLEAAARIQETLLPAALPALLGASSAWSFKPCTELAGDLLNVFVLDDKQIGLYVLDVVGHGVAAALLSVTVSWVLSQTPSASAVLAQPAAVAAQLTRDFPWDPRRGQFFTLIYGVLQLDTREFRFVSAGHPGPVYLARGAEARILQVPGFPIGLGDGHYEENSLTLQPGERLYFYSDGVPEARNADNKFFGASRLVAALEEARALPLQGSVTSLLRHVENWCGPVPPHDDISILAIEVAPAAAENPGQPL